MHPVSMEPGVDCKPPATGHSLSTWPYSPADRGSALRLRSSVAAPREGRSCSHQHSDARSPQGVHTAELSMDETGAEAEDTSGLQSLPRSHLPPFHFNRPFLLLMFEEGGRKLFFMGKVMNPRAKS